MLPGGTDSRALGINNSGEVVGWSYATVEVNGASHTAVHAFSWTRSGGLADLQSTVGLGGYESAASQISDTGIIAGYSFNSNGVPNAFSWTQAGGVVNLGTLPGGTESRATRVNDSDQVVGWADTTPIPPGQDSGTRHAFYWTQAGGMKDLGTFGGPAATASGVSTSGIVVGYSDYAAGNWHAFSWTAQTGMVDLGTLGGTTSAAHAISNNGQQIAGQSTTSNGDVRAFSWTQTGGMINLGTLGGSSSVARGVNDNGQVVGYSAAANGTVYGFAWAPATGMIELPPLSGDVASDAEAINDNGQVIGWSQDAAGHTHAVLWQLPPLPPPAIVVKVSGLRLKPSSFRARRHGPMIAWRGKNGARIRFRLSAPALVVFKLERVLGGRQWGKNCLPNTHARRTLRGCSRYVPLRGSFKHSGKAGENSMWFTGVYRNAPLKPGRYRLMVTARAGTGPQSTPIGATFTIKR